MAKVIYIQDNLPNFDEAYAEANQKGLDKLSTFSRQYIHFTKMAQKCHNPKAMAIIQHQKERLMQSLSRPPKKKEETEKREIFKNSNYLMKQNNSCTF